MPTLPVKTVTTAARAKILARFGGDAAYVAWLDGAIAKELVKIDARESRAAASVKRKIDFPGIFPKAAVEAVPEV